MRIGIDCQVLGSGFRHGFSTYTESLLQTLRVRYPDDGFVSWVCRKGPGWRLPNQLWWDQVRVPWAAFTGHVDLLHCPAYSAPLVRRQPAVMTVMDVLYTRYPEWLPTRRARWYWGRWIPFTARHADAVIAPSLATKQDLVELAGIPPDRITVIPLAVAPHFLRRPSHDDIQGYRVRHGLLGPYLLYVGIIDRRKDLTTVLRAYARTHARVKELRLVIAGHVIPGRTNLVGDIERMGLTDGVRLAGYIPDDELPLLYAGASLFVYPSRWEGFGLPPLEAMSLGVPVITYRSSSLPEVVGDAAVLIDPPYTEDALANAILRLLEDIPFREDMIARGRRRAACFSWEQIADQTMLVYRQCAAQCE
jgi:glycosyltransferase involved in cell wall biosynthesis